MAEAWGELIGYTAMCGLVRLQLGPAEWKHHHFADRKPLGKVRTSRAVAVAAGRAFGAHPVHTRCTPGAQPSPA